MWLAWNSNQCLFPADIERALHEVIPEQVSYSNAMGKDQITLSLSYVRTKHTSPKSGPIIKGRVNRFWPSIILFWLIIWIFIYFNLIN